MYINTDDSAIMDTQMSVENQISKVLGKMNVPY